MPRLAVEQPAMERLVDEPHPIAARPAEAPAPAEVPSAAAPASRPAAWKPPAVKTACCIGLYWLSIAAALGLHRVAPDHLLLPGSMAVAVVTALAGPLFGYRAVSRARTPGATALCWGLFGVSAIPILGAATGASAGLLEIFG